MKNPIVNVSTNIITGFLGVGKTTAILNLINSKPEHERWAILINEAGKVGVDGSVISQTGVYTKQISGGCMCCASGLPMQAAITRLLRESRPDRLIIEPSGIGHPRKIQKTLCIPEYLGVLNLKANICLVDPRHLNDLRYRDSQMFLDQISVADILVANKIDLCSSENISDFENFSQQQNFSASQIKTTSFAALNAQWLDLPHNIRAHRVLSTMPDPVEYFTESKQFPDHYVFSEQMLCRWIKQLQITRVKAIVKTEKGVLLFNCVESTISISVVEQFTSNRIELISQRRLEHDIWSGLESQ
ncbi:Putative metal chaperone, involved in Zn homeostasis, GTPase of COG0523 family [hydrothermal vent metagenome]|uniref:Metal chaperone, involved in Zn homeostasis, GTPase of COG0523 family n=1 Tax=hydrothermal vent metagenome TaxID=652676 RepID=A0A3B0Y6T7_9ZZZZ